jgi:hypothetical protein
VPKIVVLTLDAMGIWDIGFQSSFFVNVFMYYNKFLLSLHVCRKLNF